MGYRTIQQKIGATHQFDGTAPTGAVVRANDMESYAVQNAGGLFDFGLTQPVNIVQIFVKLGGQTSWALSLVDADGDVFPLVDGTNEAIYASKPFDLFMLTGDKLKLVTTGATTAMKARVTINTRP